MALVAHPDRDNVWVKPELIKPEWIAQEWVRPESGFEFLSHQPAWNGFKGGVSVVIDIRPVQLPVR
jgi:hypothetical protein